MDRRNFPVYIPLSPSIFLSYVQADEERVETLYHKLIDAACKPWMAKRNILPGEVRETSIGNAIRHADFFLACLSTNSVGQRGGIQREMKRALDIWQEKLDHDIYLIPVRFEICETPDNLRDFQWVNLFEEDGWLRLVEAIKVGLARQGRLQRDIIDDDPRVIMALHRFKVALEMRREAFHSYKMREVDYNYVKTFVDESTEASRKYIESVTQVHQEWMKRLQESGERIMEL